MTHFIGQIVFVILAKKNQLIPLQVFEIVSKKTLNGEEVNYMLKAGDSEELVNLNSIDGEIFDSLDDARVALTERASKAISRLVENASEKAKLWYGQPHAESPSVMSGLQKQPVAQQNQQGKTTIKLPDGTLAHVTLPDILQWFE